MRPITFLALSLSSACSGVQAAPSPAYYFGADLSYVNELEDCGAIYSAGGERRDVFELFDERGTNLVRVRLWNDAQWTRYSDLADVKKTIARARRAGMQVLLNYHYSDDWADGEKQLIPIEGASSIAHWRGSACSFIRGSLRFLVDASVGVSARRDSRSNVTMR